MVLVYVIVCAFRMLKEHINSNYDLTTGWKMVWKKRQTLGGGGDGGGNGNSIDNPSMIYR